MHSRHLQAAASQRITQGGSHHPMDDRVRGLHSLSKPPVVIVYQHGLPGAPYVADAILIHLH
jgi:hypothetical protein